jgi:hypothetical protein
MQNKRNTWEGEAPHPRDDGLRNRIRSDLERLGMAPRVSEKLAERLEPRAARLSPEEYSVVLGSVAAAYGVNPEEVDALGIAPEDVADVERLTQGIREEVQKLDEGLRMLSAYVARLRKRAASSDSETLH